MGIKLKAFEKACCWKYFWEGSNFVLNWVDKIDE